jgi:serine/threonine protein kinase
MIGEVIDHYRVVELLGCGAMGVVYKALDVNLDRPVAVKVMGAAARNEPNFVERFREEARMQGALNHPNVAVLFDYFIHDGAPVAVMEFIDGESLEQLLKRRGCIPATECIALFKQALAGVAAAHRAGIIHRDLKPSNLMLTRDGVVKVMDFGIARRQGLSGAATKIGASTSIGSPLYMAPEQILGRTVDCRTDIYALGVTLYELLCGQQPFTARGKTEYSLLNAHVNELPDPPTVHCPDIPGPVVDVVLRALAKEPDDRFQSADEFMRALTRETAPAAVAPSTQASDTVTLEYSSPESAAPVAPTEVASTVLFEYEPRRDDKKTLAFDFAATTLRQDSPGAPSAPAPQPRAASAAVPPAASATVPIAPSRAARASQVPPPASPGRRRHLPRPALVVALVVTLLLGATLHRAQQLRRSNPPAAVPTAAPILAAKPLTPAPTSAGTTGVDEQTVSRTPAAMPQAPPLPAAAMAIPRSDLSGTWRGEYVDAAGRRLLRVVNLNIDRIDDDGGIEGSLAYEAVGGDGACKLHVRGSTYLASQHRLQLSPEGCSPRYPKELGVPLDFDGVDPRTGSLTDGRVEAPNGAAISVRLTRVTGV